MNQQLKSKIQDLIRSSRVFLFMKGTPEQPACGFSAQVVEILTKLNIKFKSFDVYSDEEIRQGIKDFSNWPTIPQLFIDGELVGGCDIVRELAESGELKKMVDLKQA